MPAIKQIGIWWWIVSGDRFRMFPFPSRTAALETLALAQEG